MGGPQGVHGLGQLTASLGRAGRAAAVLALGACAPGPDPAALGPEPCEAYLVAMQETVGLGEVVVVRAEPWSRHSPVPDLLLRLLPNLDPDLAKRFVRASPPPIPFDSATFESCATDVRVLLQAELDAMLELRPGEGLGADWSHPGWKRFEAAHPGAAGFHTLTRPCS